VEVDLSSLRIACAAARRNGSLLTGERRDHRACSRASQHGRAAHSPSGSPAVGQASLHAGVSRNTFTKYARQYGIPTRLNASAVNPFATTANTSSGPPESRSSSLARP
jgi:hypothetical protein